jgi:ribosome-associated protein
MKEYKLKEEYIELIKLLKLTRVAATGGHAKLLVEDGEVQLNGQVEFRKRAKLRAGDVVICLEQEIKVV